MNIRAHTTYLQKDDNTYSIAPAKFNVNPFIKNHLIRPVF